MREKKIYSLILGKKTIKEKLELLKIIRKLKKSQKRKKVLNPCYVCESEFLRSDTFLPHLSMKELCFYKRIPRKFRNKEEDHCLLIQKHMFSNEFLVLKIYNKKINSKKFKKAELVFRESLEELAKTKIEDLEPSQITSRFVSKTKKAIGFTDNWLKIVFKSRNLWNSVDYAIKLCKIYYINYKCPFRPCLHKQGSLAPLCAINEENFEKQASEYL